MGNSATPSIPAALKRDYEYLTGQKLIRAIKANSRPQLADCVDLARKELKSNNVKLAHDKEYEYMVKQMILYLTRGYDVGDGVLFTKTPLEIAEMNHSDVAIAFINETLSQLNRNEIGSKILADRGVSGITPVSATIGAVDKDRVAQAKERLKAFQQDKK